MRVNNAILDVIEREFRIKNGSWTREAVSYVGLKHPLPKGWKQKLLAEGVPSHAPMAKGVSIKDHLWVNGIDIFHDEAIEEYAAHHTASHKDQHLYVMSQLSSLETLANDLRIKADELKNEIRELRKSISRDEF